jgi:hypothetical protein
MQTLCLIALQLLLAVRCWTIVEPNGDTLWRAGEDGVVQWEASSTDEATAADESGLMVNVDLMVGPGDGVVVMAIASNIPASNNQLSWHVSQSLSTRSDYFVRLSSAGGNAKLANGDRFYILSPDNSPPDDDASAADFGMSTGGAKTAALISTLLLAFLYTH